MRIKKILIIATRQIGDTLITTPLVSAIKKKWPDAQIGFLGYQSSMNMLTGNTDIHELIGTKSHSKFIDYLKQFFQLFQRYDLAFITQPSDRAYIYGLVAARHRVGVIPSEPKLNWWKKKICLHTVEVNYFHQHVITEKLRLMELWLNAEELFGTGISVRPPKSVDLLANIQEQLSNSTIVIHPSPLTAYKRWPLANWVKLIEILSKNYQIILSGAPVAQDRELNQSIIDLLNPSTKEKILNLDGRLKLDQLSTLLRQTNLYIGVDTSVTHLAAACNAPTIVLFGATPPTNFGPWPNGFIGKQPYQLRSPIQKVGNVSIIQGPGDCVPCRKAGCDDHPNSRSDCLVNLSVDSVLSAITAYGIKY